MKKNLGKLIMSVRYPEITSLKFSSNLKKATIDTINHADDIIDINPTEYLSPKEGLGRTIYKKIKERGSKIADRLLQEVEDHDDGFFFGGA